MSSQEYLTTPLIWNASDRKNVVYESVTLQGEKLLLRVGEFPEEPMYALFSVRGAVEHFVCTVDDFPPSWVRA